MNLTTEDIERFWENVDKGPGQGPNGDCWEWKGSCWAKNSNINNRRGYGVFEGVSAHRVAAFLTTENWNPDLIVMHSCNNSLCCNPAHLSLGTISQNLKDAGRDGLFRHRPPITTEERLRIIDLWENNRPITLTEISYRLHRSRLSIRNILHEAGIRIVESRSNVHNKQKNG